MSIGSQDKIINQYINKIANTLHCDSNSVFLYRKGRVGLYAILQAIGIKPEDEVIISGFTCRTVPHTIKSLGAIPIYADIKEGSFTIDLDSIKKSISPKTRVVITQNTFGLSCDLEDIHNWAKENNILHIEDCAHGFGGLYQGLPNGHIGDAAFFSTHAHKPFSTGIGGFIVVNNKNILNNIVRINTMIVNSPVFYDCLMLPVIYYWRDYKYLCHISYIAVWLRNNLKRLFAKRQEEYNKRFMAFPSITQIKYGIKKFDTINYIIKLRKKNAELYTEFLKSHHKIFVPEHLNNNHLFLYYPILVNDKKRVLTIAKEYGIDVNGIFNLKQNPKLLNIDYSRLPITVKISKHLVNLPTIIESRSNMLNFLHQIINEIR